MDLRISRELVIEFSTTLTQAILSDFRYEIGQEFD